MVPIHTQPFSFGPNSSMFAYLKVLDRYTQFSGRASTVFLPPYSSANIERLRGKDGEQIGTYWLWVSLKWIFQFGAESGVVYPDFGNFGMVLIVVLSSVQYHNKVTCFMLQQIEETCSLGAHASVIVPPTWIIRVRKPQVLQWSTHIHTHTQTQLCCFNGCICFCLLRRH